MSVRGGGDFSTQCMVATPRIHPRIRSWDSNVNVISQDPENRISQAIVSTNYLTSVARPRHVNMLPPVRSIERVDFNLLLQCY